MTIGRNDFPRGSGLFRKHDFILRDTSRGTTVLLDERRIDETIDFMRREHLARLELNQSLGFRSSSLAFLTRFSFLTGFEIINHKITDISPIHCLTELENLSVQTYCRSPIDFGVFPKLRDVRLFWRARARSLFRAHRLESLHLDYYKSRDVNALRRLLSLRCLVITNSPIREINGLGVMSDLRVLELVNLRPLQHLDPVASLTHLERLEVDGSRRLSDIECLARLPNLRELLLCNVGTIPTLRPLAHLRELHTLYFWEDTTVKDGDLTILLQLPKLKRVAFRNRRHYSHTCEDIERCIVSA